MNKFGADPLFILKSLVLCTIGVLILQTFDIQVLNRNVYQVKSKSMVTHTKNLYAERGSIMDRNGVVFAESIRDTSDNLGYSSLFLQGSLASQIVGKVGFDGRYKFREPSIPSRFWGVFLFFNWGCNSSNVSQASFASCKA